MGTDLIAMGFTGGDPKIWFATAPVKLAFPERKDIPALVFFRPENDAYKRVNQVQPGMFRLNRYLLPQIPGSTVEEESDQFRKTPGFPTGYVWLRAEFEQAVSATDRPVVLVHPWPDVIDFGQTTGKNLPELTNAAIRLLWALKIIAVDQPGVRLGRLGISGYSGGGFSMFKALRNNADALREVHAFDTEGTKGNRAALVQWLLSNSDNRLRMTGGNRLTDMLSIERAILKGDAGAATRVSVFPRARSDFTTSGVMPHWEHVTALHPDLRLKGNPKHQFAIFGSFPGTATAPHVTFLQKFPDDSGF